MDILPTLAGLCGTPLPKNPLDGTDIWPLISGAKPEMEREALLYFDNIHLQCARWHRWKLHVARYNNVTYSPAPAEGRINLPLPSPELYDLLADPDESYDVAAENPAVVAEIQSRIERLIAGFPENVRRAYEETKALPRGSSSVGAVPRAVKK